jgi:hypothetical protein
MKNTLLILMISILMDFCCAQNNTNMSGIQIPNTVVKDEAGLLDFYRQCSPFTDPGEYAYLYKNLPDSLPELLIPFINITTKQNILIPPF